MSSCGFDENGRLGSERAEQRSGRRSRQSIDVCHHASGRPVEARFPILRLKRACCVFHAIQPRRRAPGKHLLIDHQFKPGA